MSAIQIGLAIVVPAATQLIFIGFLYGKLEGRLKLIEWRLYQVEHALGRRGIYVRQGEEMTAD